METTENGQTVETWPGPFSIGIRRITGALCTDGKRRNATTTGVADTFFTQPARVSVRGKTVTGFITQEDGLWRFHASRTGVNYHLLPSKRDRHRITFGLLLALDEVWFDPKTRQEIPEIESLRCKVRNRLWNRGIDTHYNREELKPDSEPWKPVVEKHFNIQTR